MDDLDRPTGDDRSDNRLDNGADGGFDNGADGGFDNGADGGFERGAVGVALARAADDLRDAVEQLPLRTRPDRAPRTGGRLPRARVVIVTGLAVTVLAAAAGVLYLRSQAGELRHVQIDGLAPLDEPDAPDMPVTATTIGPAPTPAATAPSDGATPSTATGPPASVEPVALVATPVDILVVGVDTRTDGSVLGTRSDTIAIVRIDPSSRRVAVLSIPRDLWVARGDGSAGQPHGRINALLTDPDDASLLVETITATFGIPIHHYVAIDFEGFRELIDLAGGVDVAFDSDVRDRATGFAAAAGCVHLGGDDTLAYVRSRHLERFDPATGTWRKDPASDLSRIARQQDLARRVLAAVLASDYGVTDELRILTDVVDDMTVDQHLDLGALRSLFATTRAIGAEGFVSYNLSAVVTATTVAGNAVLVPTAGIAGVVDEFLNGSRGDPSSPAPSGAILPSAAAEPEVAC